MASIVGGGSFPQTGPAWAEDHQYLPRQHRSRVTTRIGGGDEYRHHGESATVSGENAGGYIRFAERRKTGFGVETT